MCRHNWIPILPINDLKDEPSQTEYAIDRFMSRMNDIVFCPKCGYCGHYIKSYRGGIRRHRYLSDHYIIKSNEIRAKYGFPLLNSEQNPERSVATEAQSELPKDDNQKSLNK